MGNLVVGVGNSLVGVENLLVGMEHLLVSVGNLVVSMRKLLGSVVKFGRKLSRYIYIVFIIFMMPIGPLSRWNIYKSVCVPLCGIIKHITV